jgi:hypothetical protein
MACPAPCWARWLKYTVVTTAGNRWRPPTAGRHSASRWRFVSRVGSAADCGRVVRSGPGVVAGALTAPSVPALSLVVIA